MMDVQPNTAWEVVSPGVIRLPTTQVEIHLLEEWDPFRYEVKWGTRLVASCFTLNQAKNDAMRWLRELQELGIETG